jgi:hypothetical protein
MPAKLSPDAFLSEHFGPFAVPVWTLLPAIETATKNQTYAFMERSSIPDAFTTVG